MKKADEYHRPFGFVDHPLDRFSRFARKSEKPFCTYLAALVFVSGELPLANIEYVGKLCLLNANPRRSRRRRPGAGGPAVFRSVPRNGRFPAVAADQICCCSRCRGFFRFLPEEQRLAFLEGLREKA